VAGHIRAGFVVYIVIAAAAECAGEKICDQSG
jgi:hypothetical protein